MSTKKKTKKFSLSKEENDEISRLIGLSNHYQLIIEAVDAKYREVMYDVFDRVGVDRDRWEDTTVNVNKGEIIVKYPEDK